MQHLIDDGPLWLIGAMLFAALVLAREAGSWAHARLARRADATAPGGSDEALILGAVFGLHSLLIGFTYGLALDRYRERSDLVVLEANAIGAAHARAALAPERARDGLRSLWRDYAALRADYGLAGPDDRPALAAAAAARLALIERTTLAVARPIAQTPLAPFLLDAVGEAGDVAARRSAANAARIPGRIAVGLLVYTFVAAAVFGYAMAATGGRHRLASAIWFTLLALATTLVLDLDRPRTGAITVSQQPMVDVAAALREAT